ncbi:MAG: septum formation protein Maf [Gammaproteobacteria bacterium]|nr:septum formation protein Maf [Gammaproteobacteria bacterium]
MTAIRPMILASSSPYRQALLARLGLPFRSVRPGINEAPVAGESGADQVKRLAQAKAECVARDAADALIIGCDQVAVVDSVALGKPGNHATAQAQLRRVRGRRVLFLTGLCLLDATSGRKLVDVVEYAVVFRDYSEAEIERYLQADAPYDCSGSFRSEGLGIALVERMEGPDPTALVGLPLIRLSQMLRESGIPLP